MQSTASRTIAEAEGKLVGETGALIARPAGTLRVRLRLQHLATSVEAGRTDVMAQMRLAGGRLDRRTRRIQGIVGAVHAPLRGRFLVLLDSHGDTPVALDESASRRPCGAIVPPATCRR